MYKTTKKSNKPACYSTQVHLETDGLGGKEKFNSHSWRSTKLGYILGDIKSPNLLLELHVMTR
uniref:Uncharacterized protein n=1 Tax=Anguilla anguilla TaxID=7936 RepID=A0A0E9X1S1_ANGAN